jgi:hypothetical protein
MSVQQKIDQRLVEGALNYAAADRSDPFAFNRAMTHIKNGICKDGATYEAHPTQEMRHLEPGMVFSDGTNTYPVTVYREVKRP